LFPLEGYRRLRRIALGELVREPLVVLALRRLRLDAQRVVLGVVPVAAPGVRVPGEDDRPLVLARDHVEAVGAGRKLLALDLDVMRDGEGRVLVGAGAPRAARATVEAQVRNSVGDE